MAPKKSKDNNKQNPFNQKSSGNEKKNEGTNILENIKNPFGSNAAPVKDDSNTKINSSKSKRSLHDGNKDILLKNQENKKNVDENKIITRQSIGLLITFIVINVSFLIIIRLGKYLIRNYNVEESSGLEEFPINKEWRASPDYKWLVNYKQYPVAFEKIRTAVAALRDWQRRNFNTSFRQNVKFSAIATVAVKENRPGQGGGGLLGFIGDYGYCNDGDDVPKNPLWWYWVWSAICFSLLIFNNLIDLCGYCVSAIYPKNYNDGGDGPIKMLIKFLKNFGRDLFFVIFNILVNLIIPIIMMVYSFFAFWEHLWTFFILNYWNEKSENYKTEVAAVRKHGGDMRSVPWIDMSWIFKYFFVVPFIVSIFFNINMLFKSLWLFWGIIFIIGKFLLLFYMLQRLIHAICESKDSETEGERLLTQSGYRTAAGFFIISACFAFIKIFDFEHLDYIPITLSIITFISIILLHVFIK